MEGAKIIFLKKGEKEEIKRKRKRRITKENTELAK